MANTESVAALGVRGACALRAVRLNALCEPMTGDNNGVIAAAMANATFTPDVEEGTKLEPKDACGNVSWTSADPDVTKRYTIAAEFNTHDFALAELLTDAKIQVGAAGTPWEDKIMGIERAGSTTPHKNGVAIEIFTLTALGDGACGGADEAPQYMRHIIPRAYLRTDDISFANDVITMKFAGWGTSNPAWGEGPWGDWEAAEPMSADTPFASYFASTLPTVGTGYVTVGAAS